MDRLDADHGVKLNCDMNSNKDQSLLQGCRRRRISLWKRLVFSLIPAITILIGAEIVLRLAGFRFAAEHLSHPIFETSSNGMSVQTAQMFTDDKPYGFPFCYEQRFDREKGDRVRIVMVGGSSVFNLGAAPRLAQRLRAHFNSDVEIINAAFQGCGSKRMLRTVQEVVTYSPEFVVIYSGHNEFISVANPATRVDENGQPVKLTRTTNLRLVQFLSKLKHQLAPPSPEALQGMRRRYSQSEKDKFYDRYKNHLIEIIETARAHGARVILGTISYNYAVPPSSADGFDKIDQLRGLSKNALRKLDDQRPNNAYIEYAIGMNAFQQGEYPLARMWFDKALLHDTRPSRADTMINTIIKQVAVDCDCPLADANQSVQSQHPHALPDFTFFLDHCHLNDRGNKILQDEFAETIIAAELRSK